MAELKLLTADEAARLLGVSRSFFYPLVMGGAVRSIKLGRRRLIPAEALDEFVASELGRQGGTA